MHIKMTFGYNGSGFGGFASQPGTRTVQGELEAALSHVFKTPTKVVGAGRTDKGVHATGQVISFLLPKEFESIPDSELKTKISATIPRDITIVKIEKKEKFNARQEAKSKTYIYKYKLKKPITANDLALIRAQTEKLIGTHDFSKYCKDKNPKTPVRTIHTIDITHTDREITISIRGKSFLKCMCRMIVGSLLNLGGAAPADGLTLHSVEF